VGGAAASSKNGDPWSHGTHGLEASANPHDLQSTIEFRIASATQSAPQPNRSRLLIALKLPLSPMSVFAIRIELTRDVPVQSPQDADARHHGRAGMFDDQHQCLNYGLPRRSALGEFPGYVKLATPLGLGHR
jgi:hypothetical protein